MWIGGIVLIQESLTVKATKRSYIVARCTDEMNNKSRLIKNVIKFEKILLNEMKRMNFMEIDKF